MRKKITATDLPSNSVITDFITKKDFEDCYSFTISNNTKTNQELYIDIFSSAPKWVDSMMTIRNKIVSLFGLKTEMSRNVNTDFQVGEKVGIFNIMEIQENEIIAGEDDKHLDFRVSILRKIDKETTVYVSTLVHYNNWFGKAYFFIIKPFHKAIVKSLARKASKKL